MSYDIAIWVGDPPKSDETALAEWRSLMPHLARKSDRPPDPALAAFAEELFARYPEIDEDPEEISPWSVGPMRDDFYLDGLLAYYPMRYDRAGEAAPVIAALTASHGLVCFDPQAGRLLSPRAGSDASRPGPGGPLEGAGHPATDREAARGGRGPSPSPSATAKAAGPSPPLPVGRRRRTPHTHAVTTNGSVSSVLQPLTALDVESELDNRLSRLDGIDRYSKILWALPEGVDFADVDLDAYPRDYIQCAGSYDGRMVCEVREDGRQYAIGFGDPAEAAEGEVEVDWNGSRTVVRPDQVLSGAQVAECFRSYLHRGREPEGYFRTEIEI